MNLSKCILLSGAVSSVLLWAGCASKPQPDLMAFTRQALAATDPTTMAGSSESTNAAVDAIARFKAFNSDFSMSNVWNNTSQEYASNVYFRDPFKELHGEAPFESYLLQSASGVGDFNIEWQDVAESHGTYYFRWVMTVRLKRESTKKEPTHTPGISMVRFDASGKVTYQQDFYDAAGFLFERLPIIGGEIRYIEKKM